MSFSLNWMLSFNSLTVEPSCLDFVLRSSTYESSPLTFSSILASVVCIWLKRLSIVSSFSNFLSTASSFDPTPSAISKASNTSSVSDAVECAFALSFDFFSSGDGKLLTGFSVCPALKNYKFPRRFRELAKAIRTRVDEDGVVSPVSLHRGLFTVGALDNLDHNPSSLHHKALSMVLVLVCSNFHPQTSRVNVDRLLRFLPP